MKPLSGTITAAHYKTGVPAAFHFDAGRLVAKIQLASTASRTEDLPVYGPGFCDIQVNGFAGCDFNHQKTTANQIALALARLKETGCTVVLPTLITAPPPVLQALFHQLALVPSRLPDGTQIPGFHLEGPFISPLDGARGAHPLDAVQSPNRAAFQTLQKAADNRIIMVTLAPETNGALPFIKHLTRNHIIPALGHTLASSDEIQKAIHAGAVLSTHLGNGCPSLLDRHRNPVIAQMAEDALGASFIPDGIHLPPSAFRALWNAKSNATQILTTDCMAAAHAKPGRYTIGTVTTEVGRDRIVRLPGSSVFAGSAITMDRAVPLAAKMANIPLWKAWDAASITPLNLLAKSGRGRINPGTLFARIRKDRLEIQSVLHGRTLQTL
jgi:N-acetylglucosamine-6-phosphate deacetylase